MAQADQSIQNATFPSVRADINNNLAALFTDSSGATAPTVTVAFQDWIDTSGTDPLWKKRNAANNAWITLGTISASAIAFEGTLPSQSGNSGKYLSTNGTIASWATVVLGASVQVFTTTGTFTPTAGRVSFLVMVTAGGGGGGGGGGVAGGGGGGGGTGWRMYTSDEMGASADVIVGAGGTGGAGGPSVGTAGVAGGTSSVDPDGSGLTISGAGGGAGGGGSVGGVFVVGTPGAGGGTTNAQFSTIADSGSGRDGGSSFFMRGAGKGGTGGAANTVGAAGSAGNVVILEF